MRGSHRDLCIQLPSLEPYLCQCSLFENKTKQTKNNFKPLQFSQQLRMIALG